MAQAVPARELRRIAPPDRIAAIQFTGRPRNGAMAARVGVT
jgi:hypothetical protein